MRKDATERQQEAHEANVREAKTALDSLMHSINGGLDVDALADAIANEHPTLVGQLAKAVAMGVMRRTMYDSTWRPYDTTMEAGRMCPEHRIFENVAGEARLNIPHHGHDGRLDCSTVVGAELMARQSFI